MWKYILHFNLYLSLFFKSLSFLEDTLESKYIQELNKKKKSIIHARMISMLIYPCLYLNLQSFEIQKDEALYQSSPFYEGICH